MQQSISASPLESPPSDNTNIDTPRSGEFLSSPEHFTESREVTEALQRALAEATAKNIAESAIAPLETTKNEDVYEIPHVSIEALINASKVINHVRREEIAAA